jgi:hypothetical protein
MCVLVTSLEGNVGCSDAPCLLFHRNSRPDLPQIKQTSRRHAMTGKRQGQPIYLSS